MYIACWVVACKHIRVIFFNPDSIAIEQEFHTFRRGAAHIRAYIEAAQSVFVNNLSVNQRTNGSKRRFIHQRKPGDSQITRIIATTGNRREHALPVHALVGGAGVAIVAVDLRIETNALYAEVKCAKVTVTAILLRMCATAVCTVINRTQVGICTVYRREVAAIRTAFIERTGIPVITSNGRMDANTAYANIIGTDIIVITVKLEEHANSVHAEIIGT